MTYTIKVIEHQLEYQHNYTELYELTKILTNKQLNKLKRKEKRLIKTFHTPSTCDISYEFLKLTNQYETELKHIGQGKYIIIIYELQLWENDNIKITKHYSQINETDLQQLLQIRL